MVDKINDFINALKTHIEEDQINFRYRKFFNLRWLKRPLQKFDETLPDILYAKHFDKADALRISLFNILNEGLTTLDKSQQLLSALRDYIRSLIDYPQYRSKEISTRYLHSLIEFLKSQAGEYLYTDEQSTYNTKKNDVEKVTLLYEAVYRKINAAIASVQSPSWTAGNIVQKLGGLESMEDKPLRPQNPSYRPSISKADSNFDENFSSLGSKPTR